MAKPDTYVRAVDVHRMLKANEVVNSSVLAQRFEISARHAQRIIDFLADQLNAPIEWDARRRTYFYREATFELPTKIMTEGEAVAIIVAHQALLSQQATPLGSRLYRALNTLKDLLPETVSVGVSDLLANMSFEPSPARRVESHVLDVLVRAMEQRQTVALCYYGANSDEISQRALDVYHLTNRRGDWYAVGYCHLRQGLRTFAVSRIQTVDLSAARYEIPTAFNAERYFGESMGVDTTGTASEIILEFDSYEARWVRERTWHPSQRQERLKDGRIRLYLTVRQSPELMQWILSYGAHVRVLQPAALAEEVARRHREAAILYQS